MGDNLTRLVEQQHIQADNDLVTIENEFHSENPVTDAIYFYAQQSVEKYLGYNHQYNIEQGITKFINQVTNKYESSNPKNQINPI